MSAPLPSALRVLRDASIWISTALGFLISLWLLRELSSVVVLLAVSSIIALSLAPSVGWVQRHIGGRRGPAVAGTVVGAFGVIGGVIAGLIGPLNDAIREFADTAPSRLESFEGSPSYHWLDERFDLNTRLDELIGNLPETLGGAGGVFGLAQGLVSGVFMLITVIVMSIMLLIYGPAMRSGVLALLRPAKRPRWQRLFGEMEQVVSGYAIGTLGVATIAALSAWGALALLGVPYALLLAVLVGLLGLIPMIGATIGATLAVAVAFGVGVKVGLIALGFFIAYQQLENHLIQPQIMRRTVNLNPLVVVVAIVSGVSLWGILGALMAVPIAGVLQVLVRDLWCARQAAIAEDSDRPMIVSPEPGAGDA
ncbi:AI-2E family transporter [Miltoncostaea oceani]|uniref:AI-2E family transporter n=1 Tax=Miltoncostaea oceani TaxID=2843216 RepID=UPI001C3C642B|nr:AI-2E family transporter [Miltoncostaea oceani]